MSVAPATGTESVLTALEFSGKALYLTCAASVVATAHLALDVIM